MDSEKLVRDPVCGMMVEPDSRRVMHLDIPYAFCSQQCVDRFLQRPQLYVGSPTRRAPKQVGLEVIKRRRLRLAEPLSSEQAAAMKAALDAMMGVKEVLAIGDRVEVAYDLLQATAEQVEATLTELGLRLGESWPERLRRAFVHYEEECEEGNLAAPGEAHCHGSNLPKPK